MTREQAEELCETIIEDESWRNADSADVDLDALRELIVEMLLPCGAPKEKINPKIRGDN